MSFVKKSVFTSLFMTSSVRRHPRSVLRPDEALRGGRPAGHDQIPLPRGLRRPGILQHRGKQPNNSRSTVTGLIVIFGIKYSGFPETKLHLFTVQLSHLVLFTSVYLKCFKH